MCLFFISTLFVSCTKPEDKKVSTSDELAESMPAEMEPWFGDFDGMVERRRIRAIVAYSQMADSREALPMICLRNSRPGLTKNLRKKQSKYMLSSSLSAATH
jgi:hypothetical protein